MCGIIAVLRRSARRLSPLPDEAQNLLAEIAGRLDRPHSDVLAELDETAERAEALNAMLQGVPGLVCLMESDLVALSNRAASGLADFEAQLSADLNPVGLTRLQDALWSVRFDRIAAAEAALGLLGGRKAVASSSNPTLAGAALSMQTVLSALDRLEVRGRDSAGICVIAPSVPHDEVVASLTERAADAQFRSGSVRVHFSEETAAVCFTYKVAAEIGELGDNTSELRRQMLQDEELRRCLAANTQEAVVLGHTRWASVGIISEANAHPVDSVSIALGESAGKEAADILQIAAVNGDIDNHTSLAQHYGLQSPPGISTDSKVVPMLISHFARLEESSDGAFRTASQELAGSAAVVSCSLDDPDRLRLSVHGSGQALYVGLAEDSYVVASEPYGVLEQTSRYVRVAPDGVGMVGDKSSVVILDAQHAGEMQGILRGGDEPVNEADVVTAEITTRDVARGDFDHYLLKEISESPTSIRKTLRTGEDLLPEDLLAEDLEERIRSGKISKIVAIGQGTAAVAAQSFVAACRDEFQPAAQASRGDNYALTLPSATAMVASELSGFAMDNDMSDHLIVAISQSGTTTDTNRTVDLAKSRGAAVIAIVNRRNSDLTDRADAVFYTSDGRDVEMSVASTKAFYSQIVAGFLLAFNLADLLGLQSPNRQRILDGLQKLPDTLEQLLERRSEIREVARQVATQRRDWAVVGSGRDRIAAEEVRIKLSELCYKSVSCDSIEDKKHIDLSSEPLIVVCAAGISGSNAEDIHKEVSIYLAHKACPVVFVAENAAATQQWATEASQDANQDASLPETSSREASIMASPYIIELPVAAPELAFVSSAMAGHLFAYEAALAVDSLADPLRSTRALLEQAIAEIETDKLEPEATTEAVEQHWRELQEPVRAYGKQFAEGLAQGDYDGHLSAGAAAKLSSLYKYSGGVTPMKSYQQEFGAVGTPSTVWQDFLEALNEVIDTLARPVDAIRHQAKTVTVGITRSDEELLSRPLAASVTAAGAPREALSYETLRELAALDPAVAEITGHIRYKIDGEQLVIADRAGASLVIPSLVDSDPELRGTKHHAAAEQRIFLTQGRRDRRTILIVPEIVSAETTALTLLHLELQEFLPAEVAVAALRGYRGRYEALWGAVTETEKHFDIEKLAEVPVVDLFTEPIVTLADRWRQG